jgi:hypothetical protein
MKRVLAVTCAVVAAGCGGSGSSHATFDAAQVERAFREQGIALSRLPSNGAQQTEMGMTSPCATAYLGHADARTLTVWVCDSAQDAREQRILRQDTVRGNVAVQVPTGDDELRGRIERALDGLD